MLMKKKRIKKNIFDEYDLDKEALKHMGALGFSLECLEIGGEVETPQLIEHLDKLSALFAYWSVQEEMCKHEIQVVKDAKLQWEREKFDKLNQTLPKAEKASVKAIESAMATKYGKTVDKWNTRVRALELKIGTLKVITESLDMKGWNLRAIVSMKVREPINNITIENPKKG